MSTIQPFDGEDLQFVDNLKKEPHVKLYVTSIDSGKALTMRKPDGSIELVEMVSINGVPTYLKQGENTVPESVARVYAESKVSAQQISNTSAICFNSAGTIEVIQGI